MYAQPQIVPQNCIDNLNEVPICILHINLLYFNR